MNAKVPVMRSSSGRCLRKMHLVPAGTPGGACQVLPDSRIETLFRWIVSASSFLLTTGLRCKSVPDTSTGSDTILSQPGTLGVLMERRKPLWVYVEQSFLSSVETQGSHFIYVLFIFLPFCTLILVGELIYQCRFEGF